MTLPDWFHGNIPSFEKHLSQFKGKKVNFLQIGAYSGDASLWLMENILTHPESRLTDVDTWEGSFEHTDLDFNFVEATYNDKLNKHILSGQIVKKKMTSDEFFENNTDQYDFIYVDGDHVRDQVYKDGKNALKCGNVIGFDDYLWRLDIEPHQRPYEAVNSIIMEHQFDFKILEIGYQYWIQKC